MLAKIKPFLWRYMRQIKKLESASGGEERISTESANEENSGKTVELT